MRELAPQFLPASLVRPRHKYARPHPAFQIAVAHTQNSSEILETVFRDQSEAFREAVLVEYPRRDLWTIGFITGRTTGEVQHKTSDEVVNVYVPTTPNPTSGFLLYVPEKDLIPLDMPVDEAVKMVISVGMVTPHYNPNSGRSIKSSDDDLQVLDKERKETVIQSED